MSLYDFDLSSKEILEHKQFRWKHICLDYDLTNIKIRKIHKISIAWQKTKFLKKNKRIIPDSQGIYMFVLNMDHGLDLNDTSKFVLYIGQTNSLKTRYGKYFSYENSDLPSDFLKRCMVLIWKRKLDYYYFEANNLSTKDLTKVEFDLIDTLVPPINIRFRGRVLKKKIKLYSPR